MKPKTFTQIPIHAVFAVARRENIILAPWRDRLHEYISGILASETNYALAVGGWKDHVHIFFEMKTTQTIADVLKIVKSKSSGWVNDNGFVKGHFNWQDGYGAFAHSRLQRHKVIQYIMNQESHHRTKTFRDEYIGMLDAHEIDYDERYLFEFHE
ncbi:IS200/IS605 family transposase [Spirosoma areae]